jgi:hypothetical protein
MTLMNGKEFLAFVRKGLAALWDWNKPPEPVRLPPGTAVNLNSMLARQKAAQRAAWLSRLESGAMRVGMLIGMTVGMYAGLESGIGSANREIIALIDATTVQVKASTTEVEQIHREMIANRERAREALSLPPPSKTEQTGRSVGDINRAMREFDLRAVPQ